MVALVVAAAPVVGLLFAAIGRPAAPGALVGGLVQAHSSAQGISNRTARTLSMASSNGNCVHGLSIFYGHIARAPQGRPHELRIIAGSLPKGLRMEKAFGVQSTVIAGTPRQAETTTFTVQVRDATGQTATQTFTFTAQVTDRGGQQAAQQFSITVT